MKIREVFLLESFFDDLEIAIRDRLAQYAGADVSEIPTEQFRSELGKDGFMLSLEELKSALTDLDVVANVTDDSITPKGKIDNDTVDDAEMEPEVDVGNMAGDQALGAVKDELPQ